jgi:hypothetical protein
MDVEDPPNGLDAVQEELKGAVPSTAVPVSIDLTA